MQKSSLSAVVMMVLAGVAGGQDGHTVVPFIDEAPSGFVMPPLNPEGAQLKPVQMGEGVYALVSSKPPTDNAGFIVGDDGVLVIDAHINPAMATQILDAVAAVTDKPILYLVNTNYHGDHTFGNATFPESTIIVAHSATAERMRHREHFPAELRTMYAGFHDKHYLSDVELRLPDVTFDESLTIDLGGRVVEIHHFGPGNTPGDTVVYEPETGTAWTGNLIMGKGVIPAIFDSDARTYLGTVSRMTQELDVRTIIPGHSLPVDGPTKLAMYASYLTDLVADVRASIRAGNSLDTTIRVVTIDERFLPPKDSPLAELRPLMIGFHRMNVKRTYQAEADRNDSVHDSK